MFKGYWEMPEETTAALTQDGYLKSGDIGLMDDAGFLTITDHKNTSPSPPSAKTSPPENRFLRDPLFTHVIVFGDRRRFLTALMTVNADRAALIAARHKIPFTSPHDLLDSLAFPRTLDDHVVDRNSDAARFDTIKRYRILKKDFSQATGKLRL